MFPEGLHILVDEHTGQCTVQLLPEFQFENHIIAAILMCSCVDLGIYIYGPLKVLYLFLHASSTATGKLALPA